LLESAIYSAVPIEYAPWVYAGTQILIPYGATRIASIGAAENAARSVAQSETFYRTMSRADYETLVRTGRIPATSETFISPTRSFSEAYEGVLVEFKVNPGTTDALRSIGVTDHSALVRQQLGELPQVSKGWTANNAFLKGEGTQVNIGLGRGKALEIFNQNISGYEALRK
jgi:hypothetical protein